MSTNDVSALADGLQFTAPGPGHSWAVYWAPGALAVNTFQVTMFGHLDRLTYDIAAQREPTFPTLVAWGTGGGVDVAPSGGPGFLYLSHAAPVVIGTASAPLQFHATNASATGTGPRDVTDPLVYEGALLGHVSYCVSLAAAGSPLGTIPSGGFAIGFIGEGLAPVGTATLWGVDQNGNAASVRFSCSTDASSGSQGSAAVVGNTPMRLDLGGSQFVNPVAGQPPSYKFRVDNREGDAISSVALSGLAVRYRTHAPPLAGAPAVKLSLLS